MDMLKLSLDGKSIILSSMIFAFAFSVINIFIKDGIHKEAFSELISVLITSFVTSGIVFIICKNANVKIFKNEIMAFNGVKNSESAIFGIYMITTLGIFMEVISRIIFDLNNNKDKTVDTPWKEQFKQGIDIGKNYISEKTNLIILILLGVSLFLICSNINKGMKVSEICSNSQIFAYLLIAVTANIGLILAILVTACIYASLNRKKTVYKTTSENKVDGKRSLKL